MATPRRSYRTPSGRISYRTMAADLDRQHQAALRELEAIPRWLRATCSGISRLLRRKGRHGI